MSTLKEVLGERGKVEKENQEESVDFEKLLYTSLVHGTKASNSLPGEEEDYDYYASLPEFKEKIEDFRTRIVNLIHQFASRVDSSDELFKLHELIDADPADFATFEPVADVVDLLLENVDSYLDEAKGLKKSSNSQIAVSKSELVRDVRAGLLGVVTHDENISRPQAMFEDKIDNSRSPFIPKLKEKLHAVVPLPPNGLTPILPEEKESEKKSLYEDPKSESLCLVEAHVRSLGVDVERHQQPRYPNPYEPEIRAALASPPSWLFQKCEPTNYKALDQVPCTWISNLNQLKKMCNDLEEEIEIAVDLENHSYRSFQGFVCLMQVSTRRADYIVDTLAVRSHMHILNQVFTNPAIVKVFHGSDSDVLWLQRDFGLYLVSLFDTGQAARVLGYPSAGLAFALQHHCGVKANKAYQLADWRIRPLSEKMLKYAREDTHYLLYVYDKMRNELLDNIFFSSNRDTRDDDRTAPIWKVLKKSAAIALTSYEKDIYTKSSYRRLIVKKNLHLSPQQESVLSRLYEWRDNVARQKDESYQYVLPQRVLIRIVTDLPRSVSELERCCNPVPHLVQVHAEQVMEAIKTGMSADTTEKGHTHKSATSKAKDSVVSTEAKAGNQFRGPQPISLGVNSLSSSFVPIAKNDDASRAPPLSFAAATAAGIKKVAKSSPSHSIQHGVSADRKEILRTDSDAFRATPSPVLTTEQLYDTAGWQDIPSGQVPLPNRKSNNMIGFGVDSNVESKDSKLLRTAADTHAQIGQEALRGFGVMQNTTPFAAMATAMANSYNKEGQVSTSDSMSSMDGDVALTSGASVENINFQSQKTKTVAEDDVTNIDTPANADALESDDIPRSMAEIYRISNRNRKRNKEKKKLKEGGSNAGGEDYDDVSDTKKVRSDSNVGRKRQKNSGEPSDSSVARGTDGAVEFMRGIGWVNNEEKPVANLVVQGAPTQPPHLAGATSPSKRELSATSAGKQRSGVRKKNQNSPQRNFSRDRSHSNASNQGQNTSFSYSQAAATAAGAKWDGQMNSNNNNTSSRQNRGGNRNRGRGRGRHNMGNQNRSISYR